MKKATWLLFLFLHVTLFAQSLEKISADKAGFDLRKMSRIDELITQSISEKLIPGAVILILKNNKIAYKKAFGHRLLVPYKLEMMENTIFDMASLTKPIVAATSLMILLDKAELRLQDPVSYFLENYLPWIDDETKEKAEIKIIHLLTHTSGLPAYAHPDMLQKTYGRADKEILYKHIETVQRISKPGTKFKYSGLNFITLQRIIEKITGQTIADFAQANIFDPLGMSSTGYKLSTEQLRNCAATEKLDDNVLIGKVHDPMARVAMKGISANAGLFSTAGDLGIYSAMLLSGGQWNGHKILSPAVLKVFTSMPEGYEQFGRALGWDLNSAYASNQGDLLSIDTFGHTGYTGTSIVFDPQKELVIILLTNRVHPEDKGSLVRLRSLVANAVVSALI